VLIEVAIDVSVLSLGVLGTSKAGGWNSSQRPIFFPDRIWDEALPKRPVSATFRAPFRMDS
jgi:hypothetical protein